MTSRRLVGPSEHFLQLIEFDILALDNLLDLVVAIQRDGNRVSLTLPVRARFHPLVKQSAFQMHPLLHQSALHFTHALLQAACNARAYVSFKTNAIGNQVGVHVVALHGRPESLVVGMLEGFVELI